MSAAGRPSYRIQPKLLRELRRELRWTQRALALKAYERRGMPAKTEAMKRSQWSNYQRVEATGRTSLAFAEALVSVFRNRSALDPRYTLGYLTKGSIELLRDPVPQILEQLDRELSNGLNLELKRLLEERASHGERDDVLRSLAREIADQLERACLQQDREVLAYLADLTGWCVEDLVRGINVLGHWLVTSNSLGHPGTEPRTSIVHGVVDGIEQVVHDASTWIRAARNEASSKPPDSRALLVEDGPWLRLRLEGPTRPDVRPQFAMVRGESSQDGLRWVKATDWDRFWIAKLESWLFSNFNFVRGLGMADVVPADVRRLCLGISRAAPEQALDVDSAELVCIHHGALAELPEVSRQAAEREGLQHLFTVNWLAEGLVEVLEPLLAAHHPARWRVGLASGAIWIFGETCDAAAVGANCAYLIDLREDVPDQVSPRRAPWNRASRGEVLKELKQLPQLFQPVIQLLEQLPDHLVEMPWTA